jgi:hypothetical protein
MDRATLGHTPLDYDNPAYMYVLKSAYKRVPWDRRALHLLILGTAALAIRISALALARPDR